MKKTRKIVKMSITTIVSLLLCLIVPITASAVEVKIGDPIQYDSNYGWSAETMTVDGNIAFCLEPSLQVSEGNYSSVTKSTNQDLIKAMYYGYNGPGWSSDGIKAVMDKAKSDHWLGASGNNLYYLLTHRVSSYLYGSSLWNEPKLPLDWQKAVQEVATAIKNKPSVNGYAVNIVSTGNNSQKLGYLIHDSLILQLEKASTLPKISTGSKCYSLEGAVYGVYTDKACTQKVGSITTNASGKGSLNNVAAGKTYYTKELIAPKGYALDKTVYTFTDSGKTSNGLKLYATSVSDTPKNAPVTVMVRKNDRDGKPVANAEFTIVYYADYLTLEQTATTEGLRYWVLKTDENGVAVLSNEHLVKGSSFYMSGSGNPTAYVVLTFLIATMITTSKRKRGRLL